MGDQRAYENGRNDFQSYTYTTVSPRVTINGVTGKMVEKKNEFKTSHNDLPAYGGTSEIYFAPGPDGFASHAKVYGSDRRMCKDFDWDHEHKNKDGTIFEKGIIHVQEYSVARYKDAKTGKWKDRFVRKKAARLMTEDEIKKYGPILLHFNPKLKFK